MQSKKTMVLVPYKKTTITGFVTRTLPPKQVKGGHWLYEVTAPSESFGYGEIVGYFRKEEIEFISFNQ